MPLSLTVTVSSFYNISPKNGGAAGGGQPQGGQHADGGRFAGPVVAQKAKDFALRHLQGKVVYGHIIAVATG